MPLLERDYQTKATAMTQLFRRQEEMLRRTKQPSEDEEDCTEKEDKQKKAANAGK